MCMIGKSEIPGHWLHLICALVETGLVTNHHTMMLRVTQIGLCQYIPCENDQFKDCPNTFCI